MKHPSVILASVMTVAVVGTALGLTVFGDRRHPASATSSAAAIQDPGVRDALADGAVSADELKAAVDAALNCLDRESVPHSAPTFNTAGYVPQWEFMVGPSAPDVAAQHSAIHNECFAAHLRPVQAMWVAQHAPSPDQQSQREATAVSCAQARGIPAKDFGTLRSLLQGAAEHEAREIQRCIALGLTGVDPLAR